VDYTAVSKTPTLQKWCWYCILHFLSDSIPNLTFFSLFLSFKEEKCDACWDDLRSGETGKAFVCSSTHDWYELPPWTMEKYLHTCKGFILMKTDDGGIVGAALAFHLSEAISRHHTILINQSLDDLL
jgi:hypothetical protein